MPAVSAYAYDAFISYSHRHDAVLGPTLHADLQRFAKPWYKTRALRIFLDAADLSPSPGMWPSLQEGLRSSEFFILLASADAAKSKWVNREVQWWLTHHRPLDQLLLVATGPGLAWDEEERDWVADAPVPPALRGAFSHEPLWVNLSDIQLDDHRPVIPADRVGTLAAAIQRVPKNKLVGDHLRQHRRAMRLAQGAIATLTTLTALAVTASLIAIGQRNTAVTQSRNAQSEQLATEATDLSATNAPLAMLLSVAAYERAPTADARTALTQAAKQPLDLLLTTGTSAVSAIAYTRDGKDLATGDADGRIALWNIATRQAARITIGNSGNSPISALAFSPDQQTFYAGNEAGAFAEWDTQTGKSETSSGPNPIQCLTFSPTGKFLAAGFADGNTLLSNVATGQGMNLSEGYQGTKADRGTNNSITAFAQPISSIAFSPDGQTLAVGDTSGGIQLWDTATGHRAKTLVREAGGQGIASLAFSPDGKTLAVAGYSDRVRLWNVSSGQEIATLSEDSPVNSVAFSRSGDTLAAGTQDGTVGLWNVSTRVQTATFGEGAPVTTVAFSPDGATLAAADASGHVGLWNTAPSAQGAVSVGDGSPVESVAFSADSKTLSAGDLAGNVGLWNPSSGRLLGALTEEGETYSTAFSPDGRTLAVGYVNGTDLWNITARQHPVLDSAGFPTLAEGGAGSDSVAFSPDGALLAVGDYRGGVGLWDVATRHRLAAMYAGGSVNSVAFSPDGTILAVGDANGEITLWGVANHSLIATMNEGSAVNSVTFSPDGKTLAVGDHAGHVSLWLVASRQRTVALPDGSSVGAVAFSPDGRTLASGDALGDVNTWDLVSHQRLATVAQTDTSISSLTFSRNGQEVAAGGYNGTVTLLPQWSLSLSQRAFAQLICGRKRGNITAAEWADDAPGVPYQKVCPAYP